jgi:hypothetical protein
MDDLIKVPLSADAEQCLIRHLDRRVGALQVGLKKLFETNLPRWRRIYEAQPAEASRSFPWENASNLVVPLAGIHCDTLHARVMAALFKTHPLWVAGIVGGFDDKSEELRVAWEEFLSYVGIEPDELDLYHVEEAWTAETIRYGTSTLKTPQVTEYEDRCIPAGDGSGSFEIIRDIKYKGPRPCKVAFEDFLIPPSATSNGKADIQVHRIRMQKHELLQRRFTQFFDPRKVDAIIGHPDRTSPDYVQQQRETDSGARSENDGFAEWDVFECWLAWRDPNGSSKFSPKITAWYHKKSGTLLRAFFNLYPDDIFISQRLLYRDDSFHGYGLCEILDMIQEEVSTIHNNRRDNSTVANTRVWRVDPTSKLHQGYHIYPSAMLPAVAGEIEPMAHGEVSQMTMEEESLAMQIAERRSGVSPPMQGYGAGTNTKRGVYTSMGTLSLLQEGNRRTDLTIADIRYGHARLGRNLSRLYAFMGIHETKLMQFGQLKEKIEAAAEMIKNGKLCIPIHSATASVNREVEKQNDLMLSQIMARHYNMIAQLLQQATLSTTPAPLKEYLPKVIAASDRLMKSILKHFEHEDVDSLVPSVQQQQQQQPQGGAPRAGQNPGLAVVPPQPSNPMAEQSVGQAAGGLPPGLA